MILLLQSHHPALQVVVGSSENAAALTSQMEERGFKLESRVDCQYCYTIVKELSDQPDEALATLAKGDLRNTGMLRRCVASNKFPFYQRLIDLW